MIKVIRMRYFVLALLYGWLSGIPWCGPMTMASAGYQGFKYWGLLGPES